MKLIKILILSISLATTTQWLHATPDSIKYGIFGRLHIYKPQEEIQSIALFVSGDGGWNSGVIDMAKSISAMNTLVIGIDITHYFKQLNNESKPYVYPASDFEALSQYIQKLYKMKEYKPPILVGYSSGATLVYALLAEAPAGTFAGALSMGFCPDMEIKKNLYKGVGLQYSIVKNKPAKGAPPEEFMLSPYSKLSTPWYILQGELDKVCDVKSCSEFTAKVPIAKFISLQKVGHGFSVQKNWMPQFKQAYNDILTQEKARLAEAVKTKNEIHEQYNDDLSDLPITVTTSAQSDKNTLAIIISGDGGWTGFDQLIANTMAEEGVPSVGLSSLSYFWDEKTPEKASQDLLRMIRMYSDLWKKKNIILVGYSYGADVLPFMISRLPEDAKENLKCVALLSPSPTVDFEFHVSNWFTDYSTNDEFKTLPEIEKLDESKLVCVYGDDEDPSLIKNIPDNKIKLLIAPGGHHYDNDVSQIVRLILSYI